jgi:hypothetical protein
MDGRYHGQRLKQAAVLSQRCLLPSHDAFTPLSRALQQRKQFLLVFLLFCPHIFCCINPLCSSHSQFIPVAMIAIFLLFRVATPAFKRGLRRWNSVLRDYKIAFDSIRFDSIRFESASRGRS